MKTTEHEDELLTVKDVAQRVKTTEKTVRRWLRKGDLPGIKLNQNAWRVRRGALEDWIERKAAD